jgi:hypothetical protein
MADYSEVNLPRGTLEGCCITEASHFMQNNLRLRALPGYGRGLRIPETLPVARCITHMGSVTSTSGNRLGTLLPPRWPVRDAFIPL